MVNLFGQDLYSVRDIVRSCKAHPDKMRMTYRVRYAFGGEYDHDPYHGAGLERPEAMRGNDPDGVYPWEQILMAAVQCAGSDYPMLAQHWGIPLDAVAIELEAVFDPRGEFTGLEPGFGIAEAPNCYQSLRWKATLTSTAPRDQLQKVHDRVLSHNMVLNALRAVPLKGELVVKAPAPLDAHPGRVAS